MNTERAMRSAPFGVLLAMVLGALPTQSDAIASTRCYASTKGWRAWIEPAANEPELIVTGVVTTPTGGSWNILTLGPTPWNEPPRQFVNLEIRAMGNIVTNAVTTETVKAHFRLPPHFGARSGRGLVIIQCNGKEVGRVLAIPIPK
jgi:hypothetical protein